MQSSFYYTFLAARQNDSAAFEAIYRQFLPQIQGYGYRSNNADIVQALTLFLFELIPKVPIQRPYFRRDKYLLAYVGKSLRNKFIELSKKNDKISKFELELVPDFALADPHHFEVSVWLIDLLDKLTLNERRILLLIYFGGYTVSEIAAARDISKQAVNQLKNRALRHARKMCEL